MDTIKVMKRVEVVGASEPELLRRLERLRQAVVIRGGSLLDIMRPGEQSESPHGASVLYLLPISSAGATADDDAPVPR